MGSTYMAKPSDIVRNWHVIDASGRPLGRIATEAARLLRGKHKPEYTPHLDTGDHVIILNAEKAVLTGRKLEQKYYYRHSGYPGGLKKVKASVMMDKKPDKAVYLAVKGMLPHNRLGRAMLKKLRVYRNNQHPHQAQLAPNRIEGPQEMKEGGPEY